MKKNRQKHSIFFFASFALALLFLALGMGMLGSFDHGGEDFELNVAQEGRPSVVFKLDSYVEHTYIGTDGEEQTENIYLKLTDVYLYTTAVYSPVGTAAGLQLDRSNSTSFTSSSKNYRFTGALENIYYREPEPADAAEEKADDKTAPLVPTANGVLFSWVSPFEIGEGWNVSSSSHIRLTATTHNIRIGEIVFVGKATSPKEGEEDKLYVIPASIESATPVIGQTDEKARTAAAAMLDAQPDSVPALGANSSFNAFTEEEIYSLLMLNEMRVGGDYSADGEGNLLAVYNGDRVYGALGLDILALGTAMFGFSPFGLRFFPMLAAFFAMIFGVLFVTQLTKSERAGFMFGVLYLFCCMTFALGKLGTPLMLGVCFFAAGLYLCHRFYARGMRHSNILGVLPLLFSGLFSAAAILVNGAFTIPVAGVCVLYVLGMVRQQKAKKHYLEAAIEETSEEEPPEKRAGRVVAEYRYKNLAAGLAFPVALLLGTLLMSLLFMLPARFAFIKLYDNPASPAMNPFALGWKSFVGGFVGVNEMTSAPSVRNFGYMLFRGTGSVYAVTLCCINAVALLAAAAGIGYAVYAVVRALFAKEKGAKERRTLRTYLVPLACFAICLVTAFFVKGGFAFILLALLSCFALASAAHEELAAKNNTAAKIVSIVSAILLVAAFALAFVFVFSVPLPADFMGKIF